MTGETPAAHVRPPELAEMFTDNNNLCESTFQDYARAESFNKMALTTKALKTWTPCIIIPDHSLVSDCNVSVLSPGSGLMYENDPMEGTKALLSPSTSEALPSPNCSWKRDAWDQSIEYGEERIDLTSYNSSPFWGQMDGPPIQEYLTDISNSTINDMRDELAALANPAVPGDSQVNVNLGSVSSNGLKEECSMGPTLAQLNDRESVLDRAATICQTTQSWTVLASPSLNQSDANISSLSAAVWPPLYMATSTSRTTNPQTTTTITTQYSRPTTTNTTLSQDPRSIKENNPTPSYLKLAALLSGGKLPVQMIGQKRKLEAVSEAPPAKLPGVCAASLQDLLRTDATPATPAATVLQRSPDDVSTTATARRSQSPDQDSNSSSSSMERKWVEIRDYIDSNRTLQESKLRLAAAQGGEYTATTPLTQEHLKQHDMLLTDIKVEPEDSEDEDEAQDDLCEIKEEIQSDYDNSEDDLSDVDSDCSYSSFIDDIRQNNKKDKRHFWQYNTQSKGPKGKRLCKSVQVMDAHCLADFEDPVFQPDCADARYKHNGKARKGDGNDITPNPWKLFQIGNELMKLNKKINKIGSDVPVKTKDGVKSKSRREKNKFASRACRLKKKAQHEAYKLKLYGLEEEHRQLIDVLGEIKSDIYGRVKTGSITEGESFTKMYDRTVREHMTVMIAGNTTDYVNTVLSKVADGDRTGGLFLHRQ